MTTLSLTHVDVPADPWVGRPSLARGVVARPRLVDALHAVRPGCMAVVRAPAGYGKTTLLCQWEATDPRPFAWVTLDARCDEEPERLDARVEQALSGCTGVEPFVLVLDDAGTVGGRHARVALRRLVADLPPVAAVVLATRGPAPLALARLRTEHRITELDAGALAMTRQEAAAFLRLGGRRPAAGELGALMSLTEGWPAGLSLALLALVDGRDADGLTGADALFAGYLADEVLDDLEPGERAFLRRTSVLRTLTPSACDALLGTGGSAGLLARLVTAGVPLVRLDRRAERLRCHPLLAGALQAELRREDPGEAGRLHRRAADERYRAGDVDGALHHALAVGDTARAGVLVGASTPSAIGRGDVGAVEARLARFTDRQIAASPSLALARATVCLVAGRGELVEHWASLAAAGAPPAPVAAGVAVLRAAVGHDGLEEVLAGARSAAPRLTGDDLLSALCDLLAGTAEYLMAGGEAGTRQLAAGARRAAATAPVLHALCLAQLAVAATDRGDRTEATELLSRARAQADRHGLQDVPACALVYAAGALVRAEDGRVEDAHADLVRATALQAELVDVAPWYDGEVRLLCARAAWRLGDVPDALARVRDAERYARRAPESVVLNEWLARARRQLERATAPSAPAPASLTVAELRILRLLPTHLSFREIAERTFVSANTVKTHANAVYRKLDVSSRSEAVSRARSLGVLDAT